MKIRYNKEFDSYMTIEHHITDTITLDGVKLIPITELEKLKTKIRQTSNTALVCEFSCADVCKLIDKHIEELKGE